MGEGRKSHFIMKRSTIFVWLFATRKSRTSKKNINYEPIEIDIYNFIKFNFKHRRSERKSENIPDGDTRIIASSKLSVLFPNPNPIYIPNLHTHEFVFRNNVLLQF